MPRVAHTNQFDTLFCFTNKVGVNMPKDSAHKGSGLASSHLLQVIDAGSFAAAPNKFLRWRRRFNFGLIKRREADDNFFEAS